MKSFQQIEDTLPPLPDVKRIYLLGSTGAGKTSIVKHIIGTSALNFPTTTQTRTTLATTEYVIKRDLPFKTTIILKQKTDVLDAIEELIQDTIQKALENKRLKDIDYIAEKLQESSDERFRLRYMVNDTSLKSHATNISENIIPLLEGKSLEDETLFSSSDVEPKIKQLINSILKEIEVNFSKVCTDNYTLFSDELYYIQNIPDKNRFIQKNKELLKNEFGSISLLVEYVRIEGNLLADWLNNNLEFVLIDGEGIAHSLQEKRDTLSTRHYDYFDFCDQILLVEKGDDPFISGGQAAIEAILLNGYKNKFKLVFSKIDKIENEKNIFLRKRIENLKAALKLKKISFDIENKDSYRLDNLNTSKTSEYSQKQIKKLLKDINESEGGSFIPLEYDFSTLFLNLNTTQFIKEFQNNLDGEHWTVVKAFSKRMYNQEGEYKHIKLIAFILAFIMKDIDCFLKRDDQTKAEVYNSKNIIQQQFSKQLLAFIRQELMIRKHHLWQQAFEKKGIGSSKERKQFIFDNILKDFLPEKENNQRFDSFKKNIRDLLLNSGAEILASAKKIIIKEVKIEGIYGHKNFSWELDEDINILLGKNGSGKSTILKLIYACITNNKAIFDYFENPYVTLVIEKKYEDEKARDFTITNSNFSSNIDAQMVNTFDSTLSIKSVGTELDANLDNLIKIFGEHIRVLKSNLDNETKNLAIEIDGIINNISSATDKDLTRFKSLKTEIDKIKEEKFKKLTIFNKEINSFYKDTNKFIEVDKEMPLEVKMNSNDGITNIDTNKLSSGEKQLLIIFLTVVLQGEKAFILLMDEPESSLHVEWQSILLDSLKQLNDNIQIIIATHNPLLVLNRNPNEIGCIDIDSDIVKTEGLGTKYLDVSATLLNYFHLSSLVGTEMKTKLHNLFILKTQEKLSNEDRNKLDILEKELGSTLATNFVYDRHYLHFLKFIKENYYIDFDKLTEISEEKIDELLGEFKELFDD
ncbi:hypothetical protein JCM14076_00060 [Methylosoma difficile]